MESQQVQRCSVRVQVQGENSYKGGKDQGATTDHSRGLRRKVQTSCEKTRITTRNVAICDDLLMTPRTFVTEWYVICDEISIFVIGAK
jgi:pyrimidine operon attenuation protein/uracil phosphoribosyltransferase